ncbi:MAG: TRAP transporter substrate-binding protein [Burkholderiaceae bacterium]|nr:TRAP transporter substrate-binding protein [Burkholderiaceae bacterium]
MAVWLAAGVSLAQNVQSAAATTTWKLATGYRADSFHEKNLADFVRRVEVETGGQLKIELHPNNVLVKLNDISKAVQDGKIEAGETIMSSMVQDLPSAGADSIPFVVTTYGDALRLWQLQRAGIERALAARGVKVLYAVPWPPQGLYSKAPIKMEVDFQNTKMRTYNPTTVRIAEMLGAKPVDVAMVDVGKALSDGRIDNMITSSVTGAENKVWSHIKYYYEINAWFPKNVVLVNAAAFNALPLDVQQVLSRAADAAQASGWAMSQKAATDATSELTANGIKVDRIPYEVETKLKRLGEKFSREWVRSVGNEASIIFVPYYTK